MRAWEARDPDLGGPLAAPLEQCAELLGVDLATSRDVDMTGLLSRAARGLFAASSWWYRHRC